MGYNTDKNGVIEWKDFELLFDDIDYTQRITIEEWNRFWSTYNPKHMDIWLWEYLKYMFFMMDLSGDKLVDELEYVEAMKMYGFGEESSVKAFKKFALDDKGKSIRAIDYGQFVKLWAEYFCSKDKNSPGSYLFGIW
uniref:EF-hand domain-containing protein n=1 Tax=Romanomermis culicivorax TaxID=13658 RepID=A0A915HWG3_ROMCU